MFLLLNFNIFFFVGVSAAAVDAICAMAVNGIQTRRPTIIYNTCVYIDEFIVDKIHRA